MTKGVATHIHSGLQDQIAALRLSALQWRPTNGSGGALAVGDVVVLDTSADDTVTTTTNPEEVTVAGVVLEAAVAGAPVWVATVGACWVNVTGVVVRGAGLTTSSTPKLAMAAAGTEGIFGMAVTASADGMVKALISIPCPRV